jgi:hypothetical protein
LQAEGFKRLVAVDITPDGDLVEVRGDNGNGKSSVLDAIFAALAGASAAPVKPVRQGEEMAIIRLDLGEIVVTRIFTDDGTTRLKVTNADGSATFSSGQTMLDQLVGHISFDPLAFARLKPEEQADELRKLVDIDIDLDEFAQAQKADYQERRDINRDAKALEARLDAIPLVDKPETLPDRQALVDELTNAAEHNSAVQRENERRLAVRHKKGGLVDQIGVLEDRLADLKAQAQKVGEEIAGFDESPVPHPVDVDELRERIAQADQIAAIAQQIREREGLTTQHAELVTKSDQLSARMNEREARRKAAIAAAKMPVEGLALEIDEDNRLSVTLNGIPFSQASSAEQLKVSTAIAMAANPKLRVLRVKDGSLLDKNSLATLRQMAADNDFQIWGEFVGEGEGVGVIMESGKVRGAADPEPLDRPKRHKVAEDENASGVQKEAVGVKPSPENGDEPFDPDTGELAPVPRETAFGGPVGGAMSGSGGPSTLFERMSDLAKPVEPEKRPRAVTELRTKPTGE